MVHIPVGNLILLRDHPKGRCKIQDRNKSELFKVIIKGERPNNFWIAPVGSKGLPREVNWRQLFDTGTSEKGLAGGEENEEEEPGPAIPHYNPKVKNVSPIGTSHNYNLHPRPVPLPWKWKSSSTVHYGGGLNLCGGPPETRESFKLGGVACFLPVTSKGLLLLFSVFLYPWKHG